jgi:hypothetical protein
VIGNVNVLLHGSIPPTASSQASPQEAEEEVEFIAELEIMIAGKSRFSLSFLPSYWQLFRFLEPTVEAPRSLLLRIYSHSAYILLRPLFIAHQNLSSGMTSICAINKYQFSFSTHKISFSTRTDKISRFNFRVYLFCF